MRKTFTLLLLTLALSVQSLWAVDVTVTMNAVSTTMSLVEKSTGTPVAVGEPASKKYSFECNEGTYVLTALGTDGVTVNGTIELNVTAENADFTVFTCTAYATNSGWVLGEDYNCEVNVASKMGEQRVITSGVNAQGRCTFPVLNGDSYNATLSPSASRQEEGYLSLYRVGTVTFNATISGAIPMGYDYTVTVPAEATFFIGIKLAHYVLLKEIVPENVETTGSSKVYNYRLGDGQQYFFRTWKEGGMTQSGYFTMSPDETKRPTFNLTESDYEGDVKQINHSNEANAGYETGDIFLNINEKGFKQMTVGDTYDVLAMRTWELTDNITANNFIEPDFHYTVIDENGVSSSNVVAFDKNMTDVDPWVTMTAVGEGTAIVLVDYDAISLNNFSGASSYLGGPIYGATWPENTGVFVVNVGNAAVGIEPNMLINAMNNPDGKEEKVAHPYVDAEFDVFYYLDSEEGATYTFIPSGVESVAIAYPVIGEKATTYNGFAMDGVTKNGDGSYTLLLKQGRNIVRLTNAAGQSVYQVLTAKPCSREIINANGSSHIQPGDNITVQYSGLQHPANKLAGIHNFSCAMAYYEGAPDGSTISGSANQYQFGSTPAVQALPVTIPSDWNVSENPVYDVVNGTLKVSGFGDPIGNHRMINRKTGRNANFTAISHTTYFGALPVISIPVEATRNITLTVTSNAGNLKMEIKDVNGNVVEPNLDGTFTVTYGRYTYVAGAAGYQAVRGEFVIPDDAPDAVVEEVTLEEAPAGTWDGVTLTEPGKVGDTYLIGAGAELAWFANEVTVNEQYGLNAVLIDDIKLGDYDWTPIGKNTAATGYTGIFDGQNHTVDGLYINSTATYQGLFGYTKGATIKNVSVEGSVTTNANYTAGVVAYANASTISGCINRATVAGKQYTAGVTSYASGDAVVSFCGNEGNVTGTGTFTSGVVANAASATTVVRDCYNTGKIAGTGNVTTVAHAGNTTATVENCFNTGSLTATATTTGNVCSATQARTAISNNFVLAHYTNGQDYETVVSVDQMESGEVAYLLGEGWGQEIGVDAHPVIGGMKVYKVGDEYLNTPEKDYELAVLTFEDADYKASANYLGKYTWSSLIDNPQYAGELLYGEDGYGVYDEEDAYRWYDENNTYLKSGLNEAWYSWAFWNGGVAVSNYQADINAGSFTTQLSTPSGKGHNESANFAVAFGYNDPMSGMGDCRPIISFGDGKARVIDHMFVNTTSYFLNSVINGDGFNIGGATESTFIDLVAEGFDAEGKSTGVVRVRLVDGLSHITDWRVFYLSKLGEIVTLKLNYEYSEDQVGAYGFAAPGYVAIDDITVRIPSGETDVQAMPEKTAEENAVHTIYDLNGRRLNAPVKGAINIIDGKKVFVN